MESEGIFVFALERKIQKPAVVRQKDIVTHFWHFCWHVPHDSTLLIVYFMSEIKLAPHKDAHWCHRTAKSRVELRLQFNTRICLRRRTFNWTSGSQRYENALVLNETIAHLLVHVNLYVKTVLCCSFSLQKYRRDFTPPFEIAIIIFLFPSVASFASRGTPTPHSKDGNQFFFFCSWQRLVSTMKTSVLLLFPFVLPLIGAQVPHWGPCPEPNVQPGFSLKEVRALCKCVGRPSNIITLPNSMVNEWKTTTCTKKLEFAGTVKMWLLD